jgi:hypothetical protein
MAEAPPPCQILDDAELEMRKPEVMEKRQWIDASSSNTRPFEKSFIKNTNFPFIFNKQKKVAPGPKPEDPVNILAKVKGILKNSGDRPTTPPFGPD